MRYGYVKNGKFKSFATLDECRKSLRGKDNFKSQDEYDIVRYQGRHDPGRYQKGDVLIGFVYYDAMGYRITRYQTKNGKISYPIKPDGTLSKNGAYEVEY